MLSPLDINIRQLAHESHQRVGEYQSCESRERYMFFRTAGDFDETLALFSTFEKDRGYDAARMLEVQLKALQVRLGRLLEYKTDASKASSAASNALSAFNSLFFSASREVQNSSALALSLYTETREQHRRIEVDRAVTGSENAVQIKRAAALLYGRVSTITPSLIEVARKHDKSFDTLCSDFVTVCSSYIALGFMLLPEGSSLVRPPEESPEGISEGILEGISEGILEGIPEKSPETLAETGVKLGCESASNCRECVGCQADYSCCSRCAAHSRHEDAKSGCQCP